jgi:hypothetical protein
MYLTMSLNLLGDASTGSYRAVAKLYALSLGPREKRAAMGRRRGQPPTPVSLGVPVSKQKVLRKRRTQFTRVQRYSGGISLKSKPGALR